MAKKIDGYIKRNSGGRRIRLHLSAHLGQKGVNIMEFCKAFNASTQQMEQGLPFRL